MLRSKIGWSLTFFGIWTKAQLENINDALNDIDNYITGQVLKLQSRDTTIANNLDSLITASNRNWENVWALDRTQSARLDGIDRFVSQSNTNWNNVWSLDRIQSYRLDALESYQKINDVNFDNIWALDRTQSARLDTHDWYQKTNDSAFEKIWALDRTQSARLDTLDWYQKTNDAAFEKIWALDRTQSARLDTLDWYQKTNDAAFEKIWALDRTQSARLDTLDWYQKTNDAAFEKIWALDRTQSARLDVLDSFKSSIGNWQKEVDASVENIWALDRLQSARLDVLEKKVSDFSLSDAGIIASIVLASKNNTDLWNAEHFDGGSVGEKDGNAVRLFKVQFQELKTLLASLFNNYFGLDNNLTIFSYMYKAILGLPESIQLRFKDFKDEVSKNAEDILIVLKAIRDKEIKVNIPDVTVNVPEVTLSESGNGWLRTLIETVGDVMKTAITSMADVLKTAIEELGKSLGKILDFIDGLLDWITELIVPKDLDFMEKEFDSTSATIKGKFPFIFGWVDTFKGFFSSQSEIPDYEMNIGGFFEGQTVTLPFSNYMKFAPYVRGVMTGLVLLFFLMNMYSWFHTRGEVIE